MAADRDYRKSIRAPTISAVICTHERRELVQRAVRSVLAQDEPVLEVVVVDDGSTDGTPEALADLAQSGLIRYHRQSHAGRSQARNAGIELAQGEVIAFLDSDDRWLTDHSAVVSAMFLRHPEAILATTAPHFRIGGQQNASHARLVDPIPNVFLSSLGGHPSCTAVRRDALLAVGGFDTELDGHEDVDLWMRLAAEGPFCIVQRRTIVYDRQSEGGDAARRSGGRLDAIERSTRRTLERLSELDRPDRDAVIARGEGMLEYVRALRALEARDPQALEEALARACRALPQLLNGRARGLFAYHLDHSLPSAHDPEAHLWQVEHAALAWPDPESDAGVHLRVWAILLALKHGRVETAARLLRTAPPGVPSRIPGIAFQRARARYRFGRGRPRRPWRG